MRIRQTDTNVQVCTVHGSVMINPLERFIYHYQKGREKFMSNYIFPIEIRACRIENIQTDKFIVLCVRS